MNPVVKSVGKFFSTISCIQPLHLQKNQKEKLNSVRKISNSSHQFRSIKELSQAERRKIAMNLRKDSCTNLLGCKNREDLSSTGGALIIAVSINGVPFLPANKDMTALPPH